MSTTLYDALVLAAAVSDRSIHDMPDMPEGWSATLPSKFTEGYVIPEPMLGHYNKTQPLQKNVLGMDGGFRGGNSYGFDHAMPECWYNLMLHDASPAFGGYYAPPRSKDLRDFIDNFLEAKEWLKPLLGFQNSNLAVTDIGCKRTMSFQYMLDAILSFPHTLSRNRLILCLLTRRDEYDLERCLLIYPKEWPLIKDMMTTMSEEGATILVEWLKSKSTEPDFGYGWGGLDGYTEKMYRTMEVFRKTGISRIFQSKTQYPVLTEARFEMDAIINTATIGAFIRGNAWHPDDKIIKLFTK